MFGSYEQVPPFGFRRQKIINVVEHGIEYRERLYEWKEINDIRAFRGRGVIDFTDGSRCKIHMNSFRKEGARGPLSLFGDNLAFRELAGYWCKKQLESQRSPKLYVVESEIAELTDLLNAASNPDDISRIGTELMRANKEYQELQLSYINNLESEYEKFRGKRRIRGSILVIILVIMIVTIGWYP